MTSKTSAEEARRLHLDLARFAAANDRQRGGAMRQIVRYLRELDTPEEEIRAATGLNADQLDMLVARTSPERTSLTDPPFVVDYPPTDPRNASVRALLVLGGIHQEQLVLNVRLQDAVVAARTAGASWEMVGAMVGISRQSAQERFADLGQRAS